MVARTLFALAFCLLVANVSVSQQHVVIVLDNSGSMDTPMKSDRNTRRIDAAVMSLRTVLESLPDNANVGLLVFNHPSDPWIIPFGPLDKSQISQSLEQITAAGGTPLGKFMKVAADKLLETRQTQRYGTYKLLILTDGEASDAPLVERYLPDILARGITVDAIGVDMNQRHSLATKTNSYRRADDPDTLSQAISAVLAESTLDQGDAGESDFDMLAGLPDELAVAALAALANPGNEPIGNSPNAAKAPSSTQHTPSQPMSNPAPQQNRFGFGTLIWFGFIVFVVFRVVRGAGESGKKRRR